MITNKLTQEVKETLRSNLCYLATASEDGKPNVVPVGLVEPLGESEILMVDVLFNKTRRNLEKNPQAALAVTDVRRLRGFQVKGKTKMVSTGELFESACQLAKEKRERRDKNLEERLKQEKDEAIRKRIERLLKLRFKPKAAVILKVEEVYSTIP